MIFDLGKVILRKPKIKDRNGFIQICAEKETMKYYGLSGSSIKTEEQAQNEIDWCLKQFDNNGGSWIITEKNIDTYIGDIEFHSYNREHNKVEIGYRLKSSFWGQGIITKCINELVKFGFQHNNYNRIEASVDSRNEGSKRVLLKNNFTHEGTLREYEFEHGEYINIDIFSILKKEWGKIDLEIN
ncbi:MAG TPA: GNAT family protein [Victivallales bacterium]|nr:GNAT family protein [Victivallales bacterium]